MNFIYLFILIILTGCSSNKIHPVNSAIIATSKQKIVGSLTEQQKSEIVLFSLNLLDTKYKWGSKKPDFGLDCSGLVSYVFKNSIQLKLNGAARDIVKNGLSVPKHEITKKNLEPGDLLFFNTTGKSFSHVGIYIGNNSFLHASSKKGKVIVSSVFDNYYYNHLEEIKRI